MRSVFGWSYPPGCSGPPDPGPDPSELSERVYEILEAAGMDQERIDKVMDIIDAWENSNR